MTENGILQDFFNFFVRYNSREPAILKIYRRCEAAYVLVQAKSQTIGLSIVQGIRDISSYIG